MDVPTELVLDIFAYLDLTSLATVARVCQKWFILAFHGDLVAWQNIDFRMMSNPTAFFSVKWILDKSKSTKNLKKIICPKYRENLAFVHQLFTQQRKTIVSLTISWRFFDREALLEGLPVPFPNLEFLCLKTKEIPNISGLLSYLKDLPNLKQLILSSKTKLVWPYQVFFGTIPSLIFLNCYDTAEHTPIDIFCAICKNPFYKNLSKYMKHRPQQSHITVEIYTDEQPFPDFVEPHKFYGNPRQLACKNYCHGNKWPIDHNSGHIYLCHFQYGIAIVPSLVTFCPSQKIPEKQ